MGKMKQKIGLIPNLQKRPGIPLIGAAAINKTP
jgi:hypothetical protein